MLSVIVPAYNEIATLPLILPRIVAALPEVEKEIIIIDDGSKDGTRDWLRTEIGEPGAAAQPLAQRWNPAGLPVQARVIFHERNGGKGAAVRTGFAAAAGEVLVIQDADLEYDPADWTRMWRLIAEDKADVVYGSRFYGEPHRVLYFHHLLGNKLISWLINLLCDITLSDIEVCYKMFRREVIKDLVFVSNDFGIEVEFTVKVARARPRARIYELGISYYGRTYAEGKKINWRDGVKALWYIMKFRFFG